MPNPNPELQDFLDDYGSALSTGDTAVIAAAYRPPVLVLGDDMSLAVDDRDEVESAFQGAAQRYADQGLDHTVATVVNVEQLSPTLQSVDVRWDAFDHDGNPADYTEHYRYIIRFDGDDRYIQVVIARPTP